MPKYFVAVRQCHLMPPAYNMLLLRIPSVHDLRAVASGPYQLIPLWLYDFPLAQLEIQTHIDDIYELYQPAPLRLLSLLALHLAYVVLCQLLARRRSPRIHEEGLL